MDLSPDSFTGEIHKSFQEWLMPTIHKLFQKTEKEETIPNSFFETSVTPKTNPEKDITRKKIMDQYSSVTKNQKYSTYC